MANVRRRLFPVALLLLAPLGTGAAWAHPQGDMADSASYDGIHIDSKSGDVIITARDESQARVTHAGDLIIGNEDVAVSAGQRRLLLRYVDGIDSIERQGAEIGRQAVSMLGGFVGVFVSNLVTDTSSEDRDRDMSARAEPLKQAARKFCSTVRSQERLQDDIAAEIPAFKPYAVIDKGTRDQCHIDADKD